MTDILFPCEHCAKNVAIGDESLGKAFRCPDCGNTIQAPEPAIVFTCASCGCSLSAPDELRGKALLCPNCGEETEIPQNTTIPCPDCGVQLELSDEDHAALEGQAVDCPECGAGVTIPRRPKLEAPAGAAPEQGLPSGFAHKTLRIDKIVESIPQAGSLQKGVCPYCSSRVEKRTDHSYACQRCGRLIKTVPLAMRAARDSRRHRR